MDQVHPVHKHDARSPLVELLDNLLAETWNGNEHPSSAGELSLDLVFEGSDFGLCWLVAPPFGFDQIVEAQEVEVAVDFLSVFGIPK